MAEFELISDPKISRIPIVESGDPLVDMAEHSKLLFTRKREDENSWYRHIRSTVLARLVKAGELLCLEEGFRTWERQEFLFNDYVEQLRRQFTDLSEAELRREATKYVACPDGVPPHSTGGAVDVTLFSTDHEELDMGSVSDDTPLSTGSLNFTDSEELSPEARQNRSFLIDVLAQSGFVNYPAEWWHWSYGDQYWAFRTGSEHVIFGSLEPAASSGLDTKKA